MPASKPIPKPIRYTIVPVHPEAHLFEVTCTVDQPDVAGQSFALPAWIPGSYMIREFAKNIVEIRAESKGKDVKLTKLNKDTWQAALCKQPLTLIWRVYAWDLSVRCAHLDTTHGFFNGTAVFLRVLGQEEAPHEVEIHKPQGSAYKTWRVATALPELKAKRHGFGTYRAANYDELVDHPVEMGNFEMGHFSACGTRHEVVITGQVPRLDMERLCRDMKTICEAQIRFFEPKSERAPFPRYVFLTMVVGDGYGGLEHRASTALICSRNDLPIFGKAETTDGYSTFLGLVSHEYFHSWNVKRIKPAAFAPYDFQRENHTSLLWIFEGFTSYYDDLFLLRTGLITSEQYLKLLSKTISSVLRGSGRLKQSVAESSFDAWTKYYRQDENSPNAIVSYYQKGSLVALALDLHIRHTSQNKKSLDNVMRALWQQYGRDFYPANTQGLSESGFAEIVKTSTGIDVSQKIGEWAHGTKDLPLKTLLEFFGINLNLKREHDRPSLGIKTSSNNGDCRISNVHDNSAAQAAGLSAGDVLIAINTLRVTATNLDGLLSRFAIGDRVQVYAFRRDELMHFEVVLGAEPPVQCTLSMDLSSDRIKTRMQKRWINT